PADELRERRLLPLEDSAIRGVQLRAGTRELTLTVGDKDTRYRVADHGHDEQSGVADAAALAEWYAALRALTVERFQALQPDVRTKPEAAGVSATFQRGKDEAPYVVHLGSDAAAEIATRLTEPALLRLPGAARELLTADAARFRKKLVLEEPELEF